MAELDQFSSPNVGQPVEQTFEEDVRIYDVGTSPNILLRARKPHVALLASLALLAAGCGAGKHDSSNIPRCDSNAVVGGVVENTSDVLQAFVNANQRLLQDFRHRDSLGTRKTKVVNAAEQIFKFQTVDNSGAIAKAIKKQLLVDNGVAKEIDPTSSAADNPSEIFCEEKTDNGTEVVLSADALTAQAIFAFAGDPVRIKTIK